MSIIAGTCSRVFQVGDVVQLKSGGPRMTVMTTEDKEGKPLGWTVCIWFQPIGGFMDSYEGVHKTYDGQTNSRGFRPEMLMSAELNSGLATL